MRNLITSLSLLTLVMPVTALGQDAVTLDEIPADGAEPAAEPAPAPAPAATPAPAPAPAPAAEPVQLEETGGGAAASGSTSAGFQASGTTAAAPPALAPAPEAATTSVATAPRPMASRQTGPGGSDTWAFSYSGYLRAPMRIGIGSNRDLYHRDELGRDADDNLVNPDGDVVAHTYNDSDPLVPATWDVDGTLPKKTTFHIPAVPDQQYGSWQTTSHSRRDWAEMFFTVGNGTVSANLAIQAFQFTDASWKENQAQFGIGQGWVEIDHDLGFENVKFNTKVGSHWARYGMAGIYDGGEFDTYLFGRTHTMGFTSRIDLLLSAFDLGLEGGFGVKQPNPEMFNRARFTSMGHGHLFFTFPSVEFSLNAMHAWANESTSPSYPAVLPGSGGCAIGTPNGAPGTACTSSLDQTSQATNADRFGGIDGQQGVWGPEYPTGTQTIVGADARVDLGLLGYLYAGYSHQFLKNALTVGNAIESIHSFGGAMFNLGVVDNYLESPYCQTELGITAPNDSCSNGTGTVGTVVAQYELGLGNFGILPGSMDLKTKLYGMVNFITVDDIEEERLSDQYEFWLPGGVLHDNLPAEGQKISMDDLRQDGTHKKKFGADVEFFFLDWMSAGLRADYLDPHSKLKKEGFTIVSPRVSFRSKMVTHEEITLQYSRYIYQARICEDKAGNVASPADDPHRVGSLYGRPNTDTGWNTLRLECVGPGPSPAGTTGFGQHSNAMAPGQRGATTLIPDEDVVSLQATMWW